MGICARRGSSAHESITVFRSISAVGSCIPAMIFVRGKPTRSPNSFAAGESLDGAFWTYQQKA